MNVIVIVKLFIVKDVNNMKKVSVELKNQAAENQRLMVELNYSVKDNRKDINKLFSDFAGVRIELDGIHKKLTEIADLRHLIKVLMNYYHYFSLTFQCLS